MKTGSVCTGYGGLDQALHEVLGRELAWVADIDPGASAILARRFPSLPNLGDITTTDWPAVESVNILTAGFPCQDISDAGKRAGIEGTRSGIWRNVADAIRVLRPELVVIENVRALLVRGLGRVLADLAAIGFDAEWGVLRASDAGAPHPRDRVFILGWPAAEDPHGAAGRERRTAAPGKTESRRPWPDARGRGGVPAAPASLNLLPTPAARDWKSGASNLMDRNSRPLNEFAVNMLAHVRTPDAQWIAVDGTDYGPAIRRWERLLGRPAPCPTEPGSRGNRRLSAAFAEWMMGLDEGHVTAVPGLDRNAQLRAIGNGVVVQQAVMALRLLLERADIAPLVATSTSSTGSRGAA